MVLVFEKGNGSGATVAKNLKLSAPMESSLQVGGQLRFRPRTGETPVPPGLFIILRESKVHGGMLLLKVFLLMIEAGALTNVKKIMQNLSGAR